METTNGTTATRPRVLLVYFTYTEQSRRVAEAMADVFLERGCDVHQAAIELTDARYADRFTRFPLRHAYLDIIGMLPAQLRGATGPRWHLSSPTTTVLIGVRPGGSSSITETSRSP